MFIVDRKEKKNKPDYTNMMDNETRNGEPDQIILKNWLYKLKEVSSQIETDAFKEIIKKK